MKLILSALLGILAAYVAMSFIDWDWNLNIPTWNFMARYALLAGAAIGMAAKPLLFKDK